ncbi:unnamed protein product [Ilex paraguariensis]|uniref:Uncharacterized protein n=1 Tax=Ilex paraguariensis TaxID=185542 RepID=A0ABC8QM12_9AQUA
MNHTNRPSWNFVKHLSILVLILFHSMAKSIAALVLLVLLFSIFCLLIPSEARVLQGLRAMQKDIGSQHLLMSKLGFSPLEFENYRRRSLNADAERVSPGGPAGQHHFDSPFN